MTFDGVNINKQDVHLEAYRDILSGLRNRTHFDYIINAIGIIILATNSVRYAYKTKPL